MKNNDGFSLIELMVVAAMVGIIAAVALPSYQSYILKSHRTSAINAILDLGSREARYYTTQNAYVVGAANLGTLGYAPVDPVNGYAVTTSGSTTVYYYISVASGVAPATILMTATPFGNQTNDTCGTFTYDDMGQKNVTAGTVSDCWKQ